MGRNIFIGLGVLVGIALYFDGAMAATTAMHQVFFVLRSLFWMLAFSLVGLMFKAEHKAQDVKASDSATKQQSPNHQGPQASADKAIERLRKARG